MMVCQILYENTILKIRKCSSQIAVVFESDADQYFDLFRWWNKGSVAKNVIKVAAETLSNSITMAFNTNLFLFKYSLAILSLPPP